MKIVFFGSAHFAVPALEALIKGKHKISCVVTQPDKKKGRHLHLGVTDVKSLAAQAGLKVFQPEDVNSLASVEFLRNLNADLFVAAAYGQILAQEVLDIPKVLPLNIHASLLPKYRGAAPINWAIIRGDNVSGVTIMRMTKKMDSGPIIMQKEIAISDSDDAVSLELRLGDLGAGLLLKSISAIKNKDYKLILQDEKKITFAPKLRKTDSCIDWNKPVLEIYNLIRGVLPWPGAFTHHKGKLLKIYKAKVISSRVYEFAGSRVGQVLNASKEGIAVSAGRDALIIQELQIEGKRRMPAGEFIVGHKISPGDKFN
ncbi:MAG: methionyl-tRNA formyltransferase [Candidatus Omnitrophica bacterium CG08_land_8_20_14_0_20_41_16]|nr:MAG: methionyl-tRNA formyltransferase [Candidatus Omnitrophica bacterium CG08_land_8_20_14_0_20_41_16]